MRKIGALFEFKARLQSVLHFGRGKLKSTVRYKRNRWDVVKRQPGIHQRHSDCGAFYAQDPIVVRSNRNRPQYATPRRGLGTMSGLMTHLWSDGVHEWLGVSSGMLREGQLMNVMGLY